MGVISLPSRAVSVFVIDEVIGEGEFVYNFYTTDQATNENGYIHPTSLESIDTLGSKIPTSELPMWKEYVAGNLTIDGAFANPENYYARYIVLSWTQTDVGAASASSFLTDTNTRRGDSDINDEWLDLAESLQDWTNEPNVYSKIAYEESINNSIFCGYNMQPTGFDKDLYDQLSGYAVIQTVLDERNPANSTTGFTDSEGDLFDAASEFITSLGGSDTMSADIKRLMIRALTDYQSVGFYEALGNIRPFSNISQFLDLNASVNQKVMLNTVERSFESFESCFSLQAENQIFKASEIQSEAQEIPDGIVTIGDVTLITDSTAGEDGWEPFQLVEAEFPFYESSAAPFHERLIPVGYMIDKFREREDGTLVQFDSVLVDGKANTTYLDPDVAYGMRYIYKVRTVFLAHFAALNISEEDGTSGGELVVARVLMASRGGPEIIVDTFDNEAPEPIEVLNFSFNPDRGGMVVFWEHPLDLQGDISSFQIYRRDSFEEPYTLIGEIRWADSMIIEAGKGTPESLIERTSITKTFFVDTEFDEAIDKKYYAVTVQDRLGFVSNYSSQYCVSYDILRQRTNSIYISRPDAPRPYPNIYIRQEEILNLTTARKSETTKFDFFIDTIKDSSHSKLKIYLNPDAYATEGKSLRALPGSSEWISEGGTFDPGTPVTTTPIVNISSATPAYKLLILNTDLQKSEIVDIFVTTDI